MLAATPAHPRSRRLPHLPTMSKPKWPANLGAVTHSGAVDWPYE